MPETKTGPVGAGFGDLLGGRVETNIKPGPRVRGGRIVIDLCGIDGSDPGAVGRRFAATLHGAPSGATVVVRMPRRRVDLSAAFADFRLLPDVTFSIDAATADGIRAGIAGLRRAIAIHNAAEEAAIAQREAAVRWSA